MPVPDTDILDWVADFRAADTNSPSDAEWNSRPDKMLDDEFRNIKSVVRHWSQQEKVWETIEIPNIAYFEDHATYGLVLRSLDSNLISRLEVFQILKVPHVLTSTTHYFVITALELESSGATIIAISPLPRAFTTTWTSLAGNDLSSLFDLAAYFPESNKSALLVWDSAGVMSSGLVTVAANLGAGGSILTVPGLIEQGRITGVGQIVKTWAVNLDPYTYFAGRVAIQFMYAGQKPSLLGTLTQSGRSLLTGNGTEGPYSQLFPRAEFDTDFTVSTQVIDTNLVAPTFAQLTFRVSARSTTGFSITAIGPITAGKTVTLDWLVQR